MPPDPARLRHPLLSGTLAQSEATNKHFNKRFQNAPSRGAEVVIAAVILRKTGSLRQRASNGKNGSAAKRLAAASL